VGAEDGGAEGGRSTVRSSRRAAGVRSTKPPAPLARTRRTVSEAQEALPPTPPPEQHRTMSTTTQPSPAPATARRRPGLKARHLHFIALRSPIGTGQFYGSAAAYLGAGPCVLQEYVV